VSDAAQYPYSGSDGEVDSELPVIRISLSVDERSKDVFALLDSGATVNALPYSVGLDLGLVWEEQVVPVRLTGNLARLPAFGVLINGTVASLASARLAFAWSQSDGVPVISGQTNIFDTFDVCFSRSQRSIDIRSRATNAAN
jgi:hypothetical protein